MDIVEEWVWFYYNQGFSIIPLKEKDKRPNINNWKKYHQQQPTKEEIQNWLDQGLFKNIAVICGHVSGDLVVIDVDDEKIPGDIGIKLDKIAKSGAWVVKTGKGYHIYCRHHGNPGGIEKPLKYKIEYRANRGYVAAPPSIHPNGNQYTFLGIDKPEDLPTLEEKDVKSMFQDFKEKIGKAWDIKISKSKTQAISTKGKEKQRGYPQCVEIALNKVTTSGMRYFTTYGIASSFAMNNLPKDMAIKRIKQFNMEKCSPPHENSIVEQAVNGAYKEGSKKYGCEFWIDDAETCPFENIDDCYYGHKKVKTELAKRYDIFKWVNKKTKDGEEYWAKAGVTYPNLGELILNEYDYNFITMSDTKELFYYNDGKYHSKGENKIRCIAEDFMTDLSSQHAKNEVVDHIRDKNYQPREIFVAPVHLINMKNGVFNLRTKKLMPHNPKYFFINEIPITYDPDAKCPQIIKFLSEVGKKKDIPVLQEFSGYILYRDYIFHKALLLLGGGKNGKSVFINLLKAFVGRNNTSDKELQTLANDKFASSKLYGKLLNAAADISAAALNQTGKFKSLVGNDIIDAEKKFQDSFSFTSYAKMIFSANMLPATNDDSYAFYRRLIILNFDETFEGKNCDPHILKKLTLPEELSGMFNWAIEGLFRLLKKEDFTYETPVEEIREQYKLRSDPIYAFAQKFLSTDTTGFLLKAEVYGKYVEWSKEQDLPVTASNMFSQDLTKHLPNIRAGKRKVEGRQQPSFNFVKWKPDETNGDMNPDTPSQQEGLY